MISPTYVRQMAAYGAWQNDNQYAAASSLSEAARCQDRGAFFGSIHATLNHLIWADMMWMSRIAGTPVPEQLGIPQSTALYEDWPTLTSERSRFDKVIADWAAGVTDADLSGDLVWHSAAVGRELQKPRWICITHMFNHQTHHRGQVHAMLTAAGARPGDTDLALMTVV
jgi:uncharacterized damage-inducible protein DinB